jgi:hypothetical protein
MCRGKPQPEFHKIRRAIPSLLKVFVENESDEILVDVCWALSYISDGERSFVHDLLNPLVL